MDKPQVVRAFCSAHEWEHEDLLEERSFFSEDRRHVIPAYNQAVYGLEDESKEVPVLVLPISDDGSVGGLEEWMGKTFLTPDEHDRLWGEWMETDTKSSIQFDDWLNGKRTTAISAIIQAAKGGE